MSQPAITQRDVLTPSPSNTPAERSTARLVRAATLWPRLKKAMPTACVIGVLVGLAMWGHSTEWKLPKFSELTGQANSIPKDWCEEHGVPESKCVECNPDLLPKGPDYGWCAEHGVHNCPLHHPDVAQLKETPTVTQADFGRAKHALAVADRLQNNSLCKVYQRRIQFASLEAVTHAGVDVELAERRPVSEWVAGNGEITYDQTRFANLSPRTGGAIWRVEKNVGDRIRKGEVVALLDSLAIGQAKSDLVDALVQENLQRKTMDRLNAIPEGAVAGRQVTEAEAAFEKARVAVLKMQQSLANLGLPVDLNSLRGLSDEEQVARLRHLALEDAVAPELLSTVTTANLLPIRSPMDGLVVERMIVAG